MMRQVFMIAVATMLTVTAASAQQHHEGAPAAIAGGYAPRLGDLMITQQIRHSKLWFAVAANNWELAEHSLEGLKTGFADLTQLYPTIYGVTAAPVIAALNKREIAELGRAVGSRDRVKFTIAFDQLTAACNACHQAAKHGFIVVQQPISPPFNNQSFAPSGSQTSAGGTQSHPH
jgi:hypothetical protein